MCFLVICTFFFWVINTLLAPLPNMVLFVEKKNRQCIVTCVCSTSFAYLFIYFVAFYLIDGLVRALVFYGVHLFICVAYILSLSFLYDSNIFFKKPKTRGGVLTFLFLLL